MVYLNDCMKYIHLSAQQKQHPKLQRKHRSPVTPTKRTGNWWKILQVSILFCTKIRGVLAVQIGASLPSAPWGVWCQQNVFRSQKFTSLSLCLMFNLLWIRNINMLLFLFNVSNKNAKKSNKQLPWCSFRNADFSTLHLRFMIFQHKTTHQAKPRNLFAPPTTVLGSFTNGGNWQGGAVSCVLKWSHIQDFIVRQASTWCLWFWVLDQWKLVAQGCPKLTWQLIVHQWCLDWRLKFQALQSLVPLRSQTK